MAVQVKRKPFCVVRSNVTFRYIGETVREWYLCYAPEEGERNCNSIVKLTRDNAREIIERYGLTVALRTEDGTVYDTPDRDFHKKYAGYYAKKEAERRAQIEAAWRAAALVRTKSNR